MDNTRFELKGSDLDPDKGAQVNQLFHIKPTAANNINVAYVQPAGMNPNVIIIDKRTNIQPTNTLDQLQANDLLSSSRMSFVKRVYSLLLAQLLITVLFTVAAYVSPSFSSFQVNNIWFLGLAIPLIVVPAIGIFYCGLGRAFPWNVLCLLLFTLGMSYVFSFCCSKLDPAIVLEATIMTATIVIAITVFSLLSQGEEVKIQYGILICLAISLTLFLAFSFGAKLTSILTNLYLSIGVFIVGIMILIDTNLILQREGLDLDDYALGAIILYIDILRLFLYILSLFGKKK